MVTDSARSILIDTSAVPRFSKNLDGGLITDGSRKNFRVTAPRLQPRCAWKCGFCERGGNGLEDETPDQLISWVGKSDRFVQTNFSTKGGLKVALSVQERSADGAIDSLRDSLAKRRGALLSSGFDYPGRHSRWDIAFVDPALELVSRARSFEIRALNQQGELLLPPIHEALSALTTLEKLAIGDRELSGSVVRPTGFFSEEQRSRQPSIFSVLRSVQQLFAHEEPAASQFGLYGAFGYDLVFQFEDISQRHVRDSQTKDCHLFLPLSLTVVDRKKEVAHELHYAITTAAGSTDDCTAGGDEISLPAARGSSEIESDHEPGAFAAKVRDVLEGTKRGDYFEVVLSQTFSTACDLSPTDLFQRLSETNPSPYMFLFQFGDESLVGASPEIYARVTGKRYETCPIAGTVRRGTSALEDADRVRELILSRKEESELTMCTDVDRNDMARVCVPGSVRIIGRRQLEFYSHLIHTVDHLEGTLADEFDSIDAFQTHMWACTVTGAPKPAAMQEIENLEASPRGWYSGAIGAICFNGDLNTGITLRTAHLKDGRASIRAGATLLFGSDPAREEEETRTKSAAFLSTLASARAETTNRCKTEERREDFQLAAPPRSVLLVDCRDSFVLNLACYLRELGASVTTVRSGFPRALLDELDPDLVFLSPGPLLPKDFGLPALAAEIIEKGYPLFGVCLGHQAIGECFGATLAQLEIPQHGKPAIIQHNQYGVLSGLPNPFEAGRYHSIYVLRDTIPDELEVIAECAATPEREEKIVMAFQHRSLPIASVQFHPESLMTLKGHVGHRLLANVLTSIAGKKKGYC